MFIGAQALSCKRNALIPTHGSHSFSRRTAAAALAARAAGPLNLRGSRNRRRAERLRTSRRRAKTIEPVNPVTLRPRRSLLYVPGSNARALERARTLDADGFILDLEDAVAPDAKEAARAQVLASLRAGGYRGRETVVRVNSQESAWWSDDLSAVAAAGPNAILIPKVSDASAIVNAAQAIRHAGAPGATRLWAMIETPRGILAAAAIAALASDPDCPLAVFVLGTNDLANETRARHTRGRAPMLAWLSSVVVAARAYRLDILDGVFSDLSDSEGFREECAQGRDLGMDGKTLISSEPNLACERDFRSLRRGDRIGAPHHRGVRAS